jgi:hypothetical protein
MFVIRERKIRITAAAIVIDFLSKLAIYCYFEPYIE